MSLAIILVLIIIVMAFVFTLLLAGKADQGYSKATKRNVTNLSFIYLVVIILSLIAVGVYIRWYA